MSIGRRVLLVDDDSTVLRNFRWCLEDAQFQVSTASTGAQALRLAEQIAFDVCFLDLNIGEESGLDFLPKLLALSPWMRVVMATAEANIAIAVRAVHLGARDYLVKPVNPEQLTRAAHAQAEARQLELRIEALERAQGTVAGAEADLSSESLLMNKLIANARIVARTDAAVLILGESGTGKGVIAKAIHQWSPRKAAGFATINTPSLSAELLESELFGHVKGAFTGASEHRHGRVQIADGGTLFLDEIGDFALALQPKLLRFIQDKAYERVGDPHTRTANVRIIAATNRPLEQMVADGRFREDLLYRLNVITLEMPSLRARSQDIENLATGFLRQFSASYRKSANCFSEAAANALKSYQWPGNIRELRNVIERVAIFSMQDVIALDELPSNIQGAARISGKPISSSGQTLAALERSHIELVLAQSASLEIAARALGIDSSTLYRKRRQYGV